MAWALQCNLQVICKHTCLHTCMHGGSPHHATAHLFCGATACTSVHQLSCRSWCAAAHNIKQTTREALMHEGSPHAPCEAQGIQTLTPSMPHPTIYGHVCRYAYIYIYILHTYTYIYTYIPTHIYIHMHICIYIYVYWCLGKLNSPYVLHVPHAVGACSFTLLHQVRTH